MVPADFTLIDSQPATTEFLLRTKRTVRSTKPEERRYVSSKALRQMQTRCLALEISSWRLGNPAALLPVRHQNKLRKCRRRTGLGNERQHQWVRWRYRR